MYDYERRVADEHAADLRRTAEQHRLATLARCCTAIGAAYSDAKGRIRRAYSHRARH